MSELGGGSARRLAATVVGGWAGARERPWTRLRNLLGFFDVWLWTFVFAPSVVAGVYYFFIASDLYLSEAKFVVRSASPGPSSAFTAMFEGGGLAGGSQQAYAVQDYILSRDAVRELEARNHLREVFARQGADFVSRFPNFYGGSSFEALFKHYLGFVNVTLDGSGGVSTLSVKAYTREDAKAIADALLSYSEALINRMNERQLNDTVATMREQVKTAETRIADVQGKLEQFRLDQQMIDPDVIAKNINETLMQLTSTRAATQTALTLLEKDSPRSPQIPYLRTRLETLDAQMATARRQTAGDLDSVATKLGQYEQLKLERELAEKSLSSATLSLEQARLEAVRHQLYIDRIVEPNVADYPLYPKRIVSSVIVMVSCFVGYGIAWLLIAGVRDHAAD